MRQLPVPPDFRIMDLHSIAFARHEDLRVWCRDLNLPTGGGRQELVRRLLHHSRRLDRDTDTEFEDVDLDEDETPRVSSQPSPLPPPPLDMLTSPLPTQMPWPADSGAKGTDKTNYSDSKNFSRVSFSAKSEQRVHDESGRHFVPGTPRTQMQIADSILDDPKIARRHESDRRPSISVHGPSHPRPAGPPSFAQPVPGDAQLSLLTQLASQMAQASADANSGA